MEPQPTKEGLEQLIRTSQREISSNCIKIGAYLTVLFMLYGGIMWGKSLIENHQAANAAAFVVGTSIAFAAGKKYVDRIIDYRGRCTKAAVARDSYRQMLQSL